MYLTYFRSNLHRQPGMTFIKVENINNLHEIQTESEQTFIHFVPEGQ